MDFRSGRFELQCLGQRHAESFVDHAVLDGVDGRLKDVGAWRAFEGESEACAIEHHRQLVLGAREREPQAVLARQHWATRQFVQYRDDFLSLSH